MNSSLLTKKNNLIFYLVFYSIAVIHLIFIIKNSVNVPFMDEWELFRNDNFLLNPSISSLFKQHNEHKLVIPNLFFYGFYFLNGFNILFIQIFNFVFYILIIHFILEITTPIFNNKFIPYLSLILLSPLNFENHFWPFQIQWHLVTIFTILSTYVFFANNKRWTHLLLAFILPFFIIFSLGSGLAVVGIQIIFFSLFSFLNRHKALKIDLYFLMLYTLSGTLFLALYLFNYIKPVGHPEITYPISPLFWKHIFTQSLLGLNSNDKSLYFLGAFPIIILLFNCRKILLKWDSTSANHKMIFTLSLIFISMMSLISLSRAGFGHEQALSSRYFEFSSIFFFLTFSQGLSLNTKATRWISYLLIPILLLFFIKNLNFESFYSPLSKTRISGLTCIKENLAKNQGEFCKDLYPGELKSIINNLKEKNIMPSFLKDIN